MCSSGLKYVPLEGRWSDGWEQGAVHDSDEEHPRSDEPPPSPGAGWVPLRNDDDDDSHSVASTTAGAAAAPGDANPRVRQPVGTAASVAANADGTQRRPVDAPTDAHGKGNGSGGVGGRATAGKSDGGATTSVMSKGQGRGASESGESDESEEPSRMRSDDTVVASPAIGSTTDNSNASQLFSIPETPAVRHTHSNDGNGGHALGKW
jgi:hypothetical protein